MFTKSEINWQACALHLQLILFVQTLQTLLLHVDEQVCDVCQLESLLLITQTFTKYYGSLDIINLCNLNIARRASVSLRLSCATVKFPVGIFLYYLNYNSV